MSYSLSDRRTSFLPNSRSASRLLEYAYNDFSIALVAQGLGRMSDFNHFIAQSGDWHNIWNPEASSLGFNGFIQPRNADGTFFLNPKFDFNGKFDPTQCSPIKGHLDCFLVSGDLRRVTTLAFMRLSRILMGASSMKQALGNTAFMFLTTWPASLTL